MTRPFCLSRLSRVSRFKRNTLHVLPLAVGLVWAASSHAASFALSEENGSGLGNAYAGAGAVAEDASTIWFNPAGMTYLPQGNSLSLAATVLHRRLVFTDTGTNRVNPLIPLGDNGGNGAGTSVIPAGYWSYAVSPQWRVGLGVSVPFGNKTDWDDGFIGRYQGTLSDVKGINVNPSLAWKINDVVSLGFGASWMKFDADLRNKVPIVAGFSYLGDAEVKLKGDDTAWTYNLGAMFQVSPKTRVGLSYRSRAKFRLEGTVQVSSPFGTTSQDANVSIKLPATWSISTAHTLNDRWEMMGDLTHTGWSSLPGLVVMNSAGTTLSDESLGYKGRWRVGLGTNYKLDERWKLRFGVAYDKTPVPDEAFRVVRLPDTNRTWVSVGARWGITGNSSVDVGYAHIFFKDGSINRQTVIGGTPTAQFVVGDFKTSADLFALQYNASF